MTDGFSLVCPACGGATDISLGLTPNENGELLCANCGSEIPIPLAAPDESPGDTTTSSPADLPTIVNPQHQVHPAGDDSIESMLGDCGSGRYDEQETIGKGGMGEIVLCVEQNVRREVAMKRLLPTAAKHARQRARFVQEAQVTGQLEHPNIVPIHELGRDARGAIYFTMKLVKGRSLGEILTAARDGEETHSLGEMLGMFLKVCDGVAFAHSRGVVHRDLKPANIMVGDFGEVLVMDWGIARILGRDEIADETDVQSSRQDTDLPALHTMAGAVMGSPQYMPPEQAAGEIDKIDHRSDIYSLGAILYEILTLERPVEGADARAIVDKVIKGNIHPPERRAPERNIPRELSAVAMKCLAKYRRRRYASVPDLQRDISLYLEGRSVSAAPDTFAQALVKLFKRNKPVSVALAVAGVILIALTVVFVVRLKGERDSAVASEQRAVTAQQQQRATALASSKRFAMQAIRAAETGRLDEAERRVKDAEAVAFDSPWGQYARGMFARTANDYPAAADLFRKALEVDGDHAESKAALSETLARMGDLVQARKLLTGAGSVTDWRTILKVAQTLYDTGRWKDSQVLFKRALKLMEEEKDASKGLRVATTKEVQEKIIIAHAKVLCVGFAEEIKGLAPDDQIKRVRAKFEEVNGTEAKITEVEIKNGEWIRARLPDTTRFLDPLRGLPLQYLTMPFSRVSDLGPLKGIPLTSLNFVHTRVSNLTPLRGMPLTSLHCAFTGVSDLTPLKGMPLKDLTIANTKVSDLGPLKGMRLTSLDCSSTGLRNLEPLKGMPLSNLNLTNCRALRGDLSALKDMKLTYLSLGGCYSLTSLRGIESMPLIKLEINNTSITDLSPLKGMPLTALFCHGAKVSDLTPLKGMQLTFLHALSTRVKDLTPLRDMPLVELIIGDTQVTDLTPLKGMKLQRFAFTPGNITKGIEIIRGMNSIRQIAPEEGPRMAPEEFWKKYDAGEFK